MSQRSIHPLGLLRFTRILTHSAASLSIPPPVYHAMGTTDAYSEVLPMRDKFPRNTPLFFWFPALDTCCLLWTLYSHNNSIVHFRAIRICRCLECCALLTYLYASHHFVCLQLLPQLKSGVMPTAITHRALLETSSIWKFSCNQQSSRRFCEEVYRLQVQYQFKSFFLLNKAYK